jgi:hypothetical protein
MKKIIKTINKFNGNICFSAETDFESFIFECDLVSQSLTYDNSSKIITDVCLEETDSYLVAFSDSWIGQFAGGILNEAYVNIAVISNIDRIIGNTSDEYYILNKTTNQLFKYQSGAPWIQDWVFDLPDYLLRDDGEISLRESDGVIIYHNNVNIYVIRDDGSSAAILNSLRISNTAGDIRMVISDEFNPTYSYIRARMLTVGELEQSSSSSSSSSPP